MMKIPKQEYTPEFKELAVKRVKSGQPISAVTKELHSTLSYIGPMQFEKNWLAAQLKDAA